MYCHVVHSFEGLAQILEQQKQLKRVNWRRLEFEVFVEAAGRFINGVNHHRPHGHDVRGFLCDSVRAFVVVGQSRSQRVVADDKSTCQREVCFGRVRLLRTRRLLLISNSCLAALLMACVWLRAAR